MQEDAGKLAWTVATLLAALEFAALAALECLPPVPSTSSTRQEAARQWRLQQAASGQCTQLVDTLCRLHGFGSRLAAALARAAAASRPGAGAALDAVTQVLVAGCSQGGLLLQALCGGMACGWVDGMLSGVRDAATKPQLQQAATPLAGQLLRGMLAACANAQDAAASTPACGVPRPQAALSSTSAEEVQRAVASVSRGCLGYGYGRLLAGYGVALLGEPSASGLQCVAHALLHHALGLWGAFAHATAPAITPAPATPSSSSEHAPAPVGAAAANAWLRQHQAEGLVYPEAGALARALTDGLRRLPPEQQPLLSSVLLEAASGLSGGYGGYALLASPAVLAAMDVGAIRATLDRCLACQLAALSVSWSRVADAAEQLQQQRQLLDSAWTLLDEASLTQQQQLEQADGDAAAAALAAVQDQLLVHALAALAHLNFYAASQRLPAHQELVQRLVRALAASPAACQLLIERGLPDYEHLVTAAPGAPPAAGAALVAEPAVWQVDSVMAARLSFLLPLLPLAWRQAPDVAAASQRAMPLVLLLVQHPAQQLCLAAHGAYAGLASAAADKGAVELLERSAPLYVARSLDGYPGVCPIEGLQLGLHHLLSGGLPERSAVPAWAQAQLARKVAALLQDAQQQGALTPAPSAAPGDGASVQPAFLLMNYLLGVVDRRQLPALLAPLEGVVRAAAPAARQQLLATVHAGVLRSEDHSRKLHLVHWLQSTL